MARKYRIAAIAVFALGALVAALVGGAYYAAQQVEPYYVEALQAKPEVLERGSRELESRATALYSDVKQVGRWHALFTSEQINGWLATQITAEKGAKLPPNVRDPRIAITPEALTLGFRTKSGGVDTVISVDASVLITEDGNIGIRFMSVRAGALPLPIMSLADELANAGKRLKLPIRWTQENNHPIAIVNMASSSPNDHREFFVDSIELRPNEMYVAGHTEVDRHGDHSSPPVAKTPDSPKPAKDNSDLDADEDAALEIARRLGNRPEATSPRAETKR